MTSRSVYNKKKSITTPVNPQSASVSQDPRYARLIFWLLVAGIVVTAGTIEVRTALGETQTWDEGIHIWSGYAYLTQGDYSWNTEHPPLVKIISAIPLLRLGLIARKPSQPTNDN